MGITSGPRQAFSSQHRHDTTRIGHDQQKEKMTILDDDRDVRAGEVVISCRTVEPGQAERREAGEDPLG